MTSSTQHQDTNGALAAPAAPGAGALRERLEAGTARVGVIGLGYVGLPLAVEYAAAGFPTVGFDVDERRVATLAEGRNYIDDVDGDALRRLVQEEKLTATTSYEAAGDVDVFFICVPTPVTAHKDPDTTYIEAAAEAVTAHLRAGQLVVLKSTTYPNTTEGVVKPILERAAAEQGLALGEDVFLAFSPERIDPGNKQYTTANTPVVVGGCTEACTALAALALKQIVAEVHPVSSPRVAEMEKLLENIFRSVNIALVNELAQLCDRMGGVSMWEVVQAAATKPFGFMPFYPGPGLGGHCIPVDPYYLSWLSRAYDFETSFITLSARVNEEMPFYVVDAVVRAVARQPVRLEEAKVLVLGVAFKKDVNDTRHAPAHRVIELLREKGVKHIAYSDPHVPAFDVHLSREEEPLHLDAAPLTGETLRACDVAVLLTDHKAFDYDLIAEHASCIIDTRNALSGTPHDPDKVMLLGGGRF